MDEIIKVKIIKSKTVESWYSALIGETFEVIDRNSSYYILAEDHNHERSETIPWRYILKEDAEVIKS